VKLTNREEIGIEQPKASSESLSLRLNRAILNAIRKEAREKDISVNTLLNQITKQHVQWHSHAATAGFVAVRKQLIMKLINRLDEAEISNIAKEISTQSKDFVLLLRNEYQLESVLDVIQTWIRISGYKYKSEMRGATQLHIVQHDMGKKWSFYLAELFRYMFEELKVRKVDFDTTENTLSFLLHIGRT
jgi:hypothetical protein